MAYILLLLTMAFIAVAQVGGQNYCQVCTDHTLCLYNGTGSACRQVIRTGVTNAEISTILDEHNKLRQRVALGQENSGSPGPQPPASNMKAVIWDSEVAAIAQMWAQQCLFEHDTCRNSIDGTYVGQNLYMSSSTSGDAPTEWAAAVGAWYDEVADFNPANISPFVFDYNTGHYSQVAWAKTSRVGCGYVSFYTGGEWHDQIYACNYYEGGNFEGDAMYQVGTACSACDNGCSSQYQGLCN